MSIENELRQHQDKLIATIGGEALSQLRIHPIEGRELDQWLAWSVRHAAPSYLPLATEDGSVIGLYVQPDRSIEDSPVVYLPASRQDAILMANELSTLSVALWLWVARYFNHSKEARERLERATDAIRKNVGGAPIPEAVWRILDEALEDEEDPMAKYEPSWWHTTTSSYTVRAWSHAPLNHAYIGMPGLEYDAEVTEALKAFEPFLESRREIPDILAIYLRVRLQAGKSIDRKDVLTVLGSECWIHRHRLRRGSWLAQGKGLENYDAILQNLPDRKSILSGTRFEALIDHPEAYSGKDPEGPDLLVEIADSYSDDGDHKGALRQLRNAALLSHFAKGGVTPELAGRIADTCAEIAEGSLAEKVARRSTQLLEDGLRRYL